LMLSAVASLAMSIYENDDISIFIGAHADDAAGNAYADCSEAFIQAMGQAISIGTYNQCHIVAPFAACSKAGVVKRGLELHTPYELTWSCYEGGDKPCGTCGTCIDRARAFATNGVKDPALED
ncbi:7-cyano-7-deazaguanine synthase, partial [Acidaminococcus timonensis]